jgi:hypothetical protein
MPLVPPAGAGWEYECEGWACGGSGSAGGRIGSCVSVCGWRYGERAGCDGGGKAGQEDWSACQLEDKKRGAKEMKLAITAADRIHSVHHRGIEMTTSL